MNSKFKTCPVAKRSFCFGVQYSHSLFIILYSVFFLLLIFLPKISWAATINAASCSQADVQAAITQAVDGDTVLVPAGSCTYTVAVVINNKNITVQGAGIDQTNIGTNMPEGWESAIFVIKNKPARITGFTFSNPGNINNSLIFVEATGNLPNFFRIDHNKFNLNGVTSGAAAIGFQNYPHFGLIDTNSFVRDYDRSFITMGQTDSTSWTNDSILGSNSTVFVENNTFTNTSGSANHRAVYGSRGARFVFRYNDVTNQGMDMHGGCPSQGGTRLYEIYNNNFILQSGRAMFRWMFIRGGTGVVYNNTLNSSESGQPVRALDLTDYRLDSINNCSGSEIFNTCCTQYPCCEQIGRGTRMGAKGDGALNTEDLDPLYFWNNTVNGSVAAVSVTSVGYNVCPGNPEFPNINDFIQLNRDYYVGVSKPGYVAYTCPHPAAGLTGSCDINLTGTTGYNINISDTTPPAAPSGVTVI